MSNYTWADNPNAAVKNKLGAKTHDELEKREGLYVLVRYQELLAGLGPSGQFDTAHLKAVHKHLFQDVYEWAGHTRDEKVRLADGTIASEPNMRKVDGSSFLAGSGIGTALEKVTGTLRAENYYQGLSREVFAAKAAYTLAAINGIHPFREGNGRTQRVFIGELARNSGHHLDFSVVSRERMIQASIAANDEGDNSLMRRLFVEISDPERVAALTTAIRFLEKNGHGWNDRYVSTSEPGHSIEVTMAGVAGKHFMARTTSAILIGNTSDLPTPHPETGKTFLLHPKLPTQTLGSPSACETIDNAVAEQQEVAERSAASRDRTERYRQELLERLTGRPTDRLLKRGR